MNLSYPIPFKSTNPFDKEDIYSRISGFNDVYRYESSYAGSAAMIRLYQIARKYKSLGLSMRAVFEAMQTNDEIIDQWKGGKSNRDYSTFQIACFSYVISSLFKKEYQRACPPIPAKKKDFWFPRK